MNDESTVCADWSDRKLYESIDNQLHRAMTTTRRGFRLSHLAAARSLIGILAERTQKGEDA